jgi:hypothetical protein
VIRVDSGGIIVRKNVDRRLWNDQKRGVWLSGNDEAVRKKRLRFIREQKPVMA